MSAGGQFGARRAALARIAATACLAASLVPIAGTSGAEVTGKRLSWMVDHAFKARLGGEYRGRGEMRRGLRKSFPGYWEGTADVIVADVTIGGDLYVRNVVQEDGATACVILQSKDQEAAREHALFRYYGTLLKDFGETEPPELLRERIPDADGDGETLARYHGPVEVDGYRYGYMSRSWSTPGLNLPSRGRDGRMRSVGSTDVERITICEARRDEVPEGRLVDVASECFNGLGNCPAAIQSR